MSGAILTSSLSTSWSTHILHLPAFCMLTFLQSPHEHIFSLCCGIDYPHLPLASIYLPILCFSSSPIFTGKFQRMIHPVFCHQNLTFNHPLFLRRIRPTDDGGSEELHSIEGWREQQRTWTIHLLLRSPNGKGSHSTCRSSSLPQKGTTSSFTTVSIIIII